MAYLHCHTKHCNWSQDDFYSSRYNPFTKIWSDVKWLWKPRMIKFDTWFATHDAVELQQYTHIKVKFFFKEVSYGQKNNKIKQCNANGEILTLCRKALCFSWNWLLLEVVKDLRNMLHMKWWTYNSFKKSVKDGTAKCPKCGLTNFDID